MMGADEFDPEIEGGELTGNSRVETWRITGAVAQALSKDGAARACVERRKKEALFHLGH